MKGGARVLRSLALRGAFGGGEAAHGGFELGFPEGFSGVGFGFEGGAALEGFQGEGPLALGAAAGIVPGGGVG